MPGMPQGEGGRLVYLGSSADLSPGCPELVAEGPLHITCGI